MEIMLEQTFAHNGYEHEVTVYDSGKILIKVKSILPSTIVATLDYPSIDTMSKKAEDQFTLAYRYLGKKANEFAEQIENAIFE